MILEVFEEVPENLDSQGEEEFEDDWMGLVGDRLVALEADYRILTQADRDPINYSDLATQAAYVFAYGMPRAGFTYDRLKRHRETLGRPLFGQQHIRVASVGGGPASELIGLLQYLIEEQEDELVESVEYTLLDYDEEWESVAGLVAESAPDSIDVEITFRKVDLLNANEIDNATLENNELVILSYVISELCAFKNQIPVEENIRKSLKTLDSGAFVFYMDSESFHFYGFFNECRKYIKGLRQKDDIGGNTHYDVGEYSGVFEKYCEELDREPRLDGNIVSKLLERD